MNEVELRDIPGYEGLYAATRDGRIWSYRKKKFMKASGEPNNYQVIWLVKDKQSVCHYVHRLIALTYIPNPDNLPAVNHKDEIKSHNWDTNLEWCTQAYNVRYSGTAGRPSKPIYCYELDKIFPSIRKACMELNLLQSNLSSHLSKNSPKSISGYHFKYVNEKIV